MSKIEDRAAKRAAKAAATAALVKRVREQVAAGVRTADIARECGWTPQGAHDFCSKHKIRIPRSSAERAPAVAAYACGRHLEDLRRGSGLPCAPALALRETLVPARPFAGGLVYGRSAIADAVIDGSGR